MSRLIVVSNRVNPPSGKGEETVGGLGVLVGPPRQTEARCRLAGVEEALAWLEAAL